MCYTLEILYDIVSQSAGEVVALFASCLSHSAIFKGQFGEFVSEML
jgi:hypothetical protein